MLFAGIFLKQRNNVSKEKKRSDELLLNILPAITAEELKANGKTEAKLFNEVTVMFTDFKGFTELSDQLSPTQLVSEIHSYFSAFDAIIDKYNIENNDEAIDVIVFCYQHPNLTKIILRFYGSIFII